MLVTVIVPIYNVEKYLSRCIDSLINQTYKNIEIILVNDGSTDGSLQIAQQYASNDDRIKILTKMNGGLSDARNFGISHANGSHCMFVDSDDWIALETIEAMVNKLIAGGAQIVCCDMEYVYDNGEIKPSNGGDFDVSSFGEDLDIIFINPSACNKLFDLSLFKFSKFPKGWWYEDLATIPTLIAASNKIAKVNQPFYKYFQRSGSIVHTESTKIFDIYKAIDKINQEIRPMIKSDEQIKLFTIKINQLYIIHCADLTTLRIIDFENNRISYLNKNIDLLNENYPNWSKDPIIKGMGIKKRILFYLLKRRQMALILKLMRGNR